jgi:hypothetical protein
MGFDPDRERQGLKSFGLKFHLETRYEDYLPDAVGNAAVMGLNAAVMALVLRMDEPGMRLVWKMRDWLEDAIQRDERFGKFPEFAAAQRYEAYGLTLWLTEETWATDIYALALDRYDRLFAQPDQSNPDRIRDGAAAAYLRDAALANAGARGLDLLKRIGGARNDALLATAADFCRSGVRTPEADHIIGAHLDDDWFGRGSNIQGALWLKALLLVPGRTTGSRDTLAAASALMEQARTQP